MTEFNKIQTIKRHFFAMRNGIIADTLRRAGCHFKIIFGLNMPQLSDFAKQLGCDSNLARLLWNNRSTRESMLLATMIFPLDEMTAEELCQWIDDAPSTEVIDVLCLKMIRHLPYAFDVATALLESSDDMRHYAAIRILWNIIPTHSAFIRPLAEAESQRHCSLTEAMAINLVEEIDFLCGA